MAHSHKEPHVKLISKYVRKLVENEDTLNCLQRQVCDVRKNFIDLLRFTSADEDSTCTHEILTNPEYSKCFTSWAHEEVWRMDAPVSGKDLLELQTIVDKQDETIETEQRRIMTMRNCYQNVLRKLSNDSKHSHFLADYIVKIKKDGTVTGEPTSPTPPPRVSDELHRLRMENDKLRMKLDMSEDQRPSQPVYNFYGSKSVYLHSTHNVLIRKNSIGSCSLSSGSTQITSSAQSSPMVFRDRQSDQNQRCAQLKEETSIKCICGTTDQNTAMSTAKLELPDHHAACQRDTTDARGIAISPERRNAARSTPIVLAIPVVDERTDIEEVVVRGEIGAQESNGIRSTTAVKEMSEVPKTRLAWRADISKGLNTQTDFPVQNHLSVTTDRRSAPVGLIGVLFKGVRDFNAMRDTWSRIVDVQRVPESFQDVLRRTRDICGSKYDQLLQELGVMHAGLKDITSEDKEIEMLNSVIQIWLNDQRTQDDRETMGPHMKLMRILNNCKNQITRL